MVFKLVKVLFVTFWICFSQVFLFWEQCCPKHNTAPKVNFLPWAGARLPAQGGACLFFLTPNSLLISPDIVLSHKLLHWWLTLSQWPLVWCCGLLTSQLFPTLHLCAKLWQFIIWTCPYWISGVSEMSHMDLSSLHIVPLVNNCCYFYKWFGSRSKLQNIIILVGTHENTSSVLPGKGAGVDRWAWGWGETVMLLLLQGN